MTFIGTWSSAPVRRVYKIGQPVRVIFVMVELENPISHVCNSFSQDPKFTAGRSKSNRWKWTPTRRKIGQIQNDCWSWRLADRSWSKRWKTRQRGSWKHSPIRMKTTCKSHVRLAYPWLTMSNSNLVYLLLIYCISKQHPQLSHRISPWSCFGGDWMANCHPLQLSLVAPLGLLSPGHRKIEISHHPEVPLEMEVFESLAFH